MSYTKKVEKKSPEFEPLVTLILEVKSRGDRISDIKNRIKENYGILLGDYNHKEYSTIVDFGSEINYIMFMLRWS